MAKYKSALPSDDKDQFRKFIRDKCDVDAPDPNVTEETARVVDQLHTLVKFGHDIEQQKWAERTLKNLAVDGAREHVYAVFKEDKTVFRKPNTTNVTPISVPARVGVRPEGQRAYQQPLWWELTWKDFEHLLRLEEAKLTRHEAKIDAFRQVARYHDKHPDTATPGEALRREGIDPRAIELAA